MWRRRDFLRSSVIGLAVGFVSGHAMAGSLPCKREAIALDEAAEVLGAVGAYGGALDALLHGRRELYAVARDQLRAASEALASMTEALDWARPSAAEDERALVLRLAAAAGRYAERLDETVRRGVPDAAEDELADPASGRRARRIAAAARAWRRARGGRNAGIETVLAGPLACALETARFSSRHDATWKRAVLESYAASFENGLAEAGADARLGTTPSDRAALAAAARARAAAAEALGLVRGALGEPALV
jgi:hypothetical protein